MKWKKSVGLYVCRPKNKDDKVKRKKQQPKSNFENLFMDTVDGGGYPPKTFSLKKNPTTNSHVRTYYNLLFFSVGLFSKCKHIAMMLQEKKKKYRYFCHSTSYAVKVCCVCINFLMTIVLLSLIHI